MPPTTSPNQDLTYIQTGGQNISATGSNVVIHNHGVQTDSNGSIPPPRDELLANVAPAALYDTAEVQEPAKCHPGTREAILRRLFGALDPRSADKPFVWLHGAAGAGKSAIARTLCENLDAEHQLLASFFFFRASADRNTSARFIPTLAHQFRFVIPQLRTHIQQHIRKNPLIFTQSITTQAQHLLIDPIRKLHDNGELSFQHRTAIVIDGLDECEDAAHRREVLEVLHKLKCKLPFPITTLVTSRPHRDIERVFKRPPFEDETTEEPLNLEGDVDADILKLYMDSFADIEKFHPLSAYLKRVDGVWPAPEMIKLLMDKTSGQFIFAKTVIRFVEPDTSNPDQRLQIILGALPPQHYRPFQQLDAIYKIVLSLIEPERLQDVLVVLGIFLGDFCSFPCSTPTLLQGNQWWSISAPKRNTLLVEWILDLNVGQCQQLLIDLEAFLILSDGNLQLYHKSFSDFLFDESRSGQFYIAQDCIYELVLRSFIKHHFYHPAEDNRAFMYTNMDFLLSNARTTPELLTAIESIDFSQLDDAVRCSEQPSESSEDSWLRLCDLFVTLVFQSGIPDKTRVAEHLAGSLRKVAEKRLTPYLQNPLLWPLLYMATRDDPPEEAYKCLMTLICRIPIALLTEEQENGLHLSRTRDGVCSRMLHVLYKHPHSSLLAAARAAIPQHKSPDGYMVTLLLELLDGCIEGAIEPSLLIVSGFLHAALHITEPHSVLSTKLDVVASTSEVLDKKTLVALNRYNKRVQNELALVQLWNPADPTPISHRLTDDWDYLESIIASGQPSTQVTRKTPLPLVLPLPIALGSIAIIMCVGIALYRREGIHR